MSIVVYFLRNDSPDEQAPVWLAQCEPFSDAQMGEALQLCQTLRNDPRNAHVTISSELRDMVGPDLLDVASGNAALSGVPVTVSPA